MANDWIKMRMDLATCPKVVRISSALRSDRLRVIGGLHAVWSIFDMHSEDGILEGYTEQAIDDLIGFEGFASAMLAVFWLEKKGESLVMPRFDEHNGKSAKRRAMDTERKRVVRKLSASGADKNQTREEKRREEVKTPPIVPASEKDETPAIAARAAMSDSVESNSSRKTTFSVWYQSCVQAGVKPLSDYAALFEYAESVGLSRDLITLAWVKFKDHYQSDEKGMRKKYTDWRRVFLRSVKEGWHRLWVLRDGEYILTTIGQQAQREMQEAA